jgi:hypothetical protein
MMISCDARALQAIKTQILILTSGYPAGLVEASKDVPAHGE